MIDKVRQTVEKYGMIKSGDTVTVGLSGGADSVCLLYMLMELRNETDFKLKASHINHGIRGVEAERDEAFVKKLCRENNIELTVFHKNIPLEAEKTGESEEECGRRIRYECFASLGGKIATAHNLTDSVETTVFNLIRGSSLKGVCGIPPVRGNIIRPLIACSGEEIRSFCSNNGLAFVTDSTNLETEYTRNFIRHELLPKFERVNFGYEKVISRFQETARRDSAYLDKEAEACFVKSLDKGSIAIDKLTHLDEAISSRVIILFIKKFTSADPEYRHVEFILNHLQDNFTLQLNNLFFIQSKNGFLTVKQKDEQQCEKFSVKLKIGTNETPRWKIEISVSDRDKIKFNKKDTANIFVCNIDYDKINFDSAVIRSRNDSDEITLAKRCVTKSLKKLYNEMKIPTQLRASIPVIADDKKVIWVLGGGYNKKCEITSETKKIMTIKAEENYAQ